MRESPPTRIQPRRSLGSWLTLHGYTLFASLGRLWRSGMSTWMTVGVIGIAMALPAAFHITLINVKNITSGWQSYGDISVFLERDLTEDAIVAVAADIEAIDGVEATEVIDADAALAEFRSLSGFSGALDALDENPLPSIVVVTPLLGEQFDSAELVTQIETKRGVDYAQYDLKWLDRLRYFVDIADRIVLVVGVLFAIAVLLAVGNTIRLDILSRKEEILVSKLIGATDGFVRRPFLYSGFWYGLFGGVLAWLLVTLAVVALQGPVGQLGDSYADSVQLSGLGLINGVVLVAFSSILGWFGSGLAVGRHLKRIEPT